MTLLEHQAKALTLVEESLSKLRRVLPAPHDITEFTIEIPNDFWGWFREQIDDPGDPLGGMQSDNGPSPRTWVDEDLALQQTVEEFERLQLREQVDYLRDWFQRSIEVTLDNAAEIFERETADSRPYDLETGEYLEAIR